MVVFRGGPWGSLAAACPHCNPACKQAPRTRHAPPPSPPPAPARLRTRYWQPARAHASKRAQLPPPRACRWSERVLGEFFAQGDRERAANMPIRCGAAAAHAGWRRRQEAGAGSALAACQLWPQWHACIRVFNCMWRRLAARQASSPDQSGLCQHGASRPLLPSPHRPARPPPTPARPLSRHHQPHPPPAAQPHVRPHSHLSGRLPDQLHRVCGGTHLCPGARHTRVSAGARQRACRRASSPSRVASRAPS